MNNILEKIKEIKEISELKDKVELLKKLNNSNVYEGTAVIIEPRKHKALGFVLKNILENLSNHWLIQIYNGKLNKEYTESIIRETLPEYANRISLIDLDVDNLTHHQYNQLLLDKEFIGKIPTETFLIFQTDSMINPRYKDLIYSFLKYEYVGAPWKDGNVGNGGFSLRRKSKTLECIQTKVNIPHEDMWYSSPMHKLYKPPYELAALFSVETVYSKVFFGLHNPWKYHEPEIMKEMCENCPGLSELMELQGTID